MYREKEEILKKELIERKVRQLLYWRRKNSDPNGDYACIKTLPFDALPCTAEELASMMEFYGEQVAETESEMPVFKDYCERMRPLGWSENLVSSIFKKNDFTVSPDIEDVLENTFKKLTSAERKYVTLIFKEGKSWDEVCDRENIHVVELCEQFCNGLKKLRRLSRAGKFTEV